jgi:saccharopine dehydrogenase (NAD+, L-lysine-forming)
MGKVLVIGAGGVGTVVVHKMASLPDVFTEIMLASRTLSKCEAIAQRIGKDRIKTAQVDADNVPQLVKLIRSFKPDIVTISGSPYHGCLP